MNYQKKIEELRTKIDELRANNTDLIESAEVENEGELTEEQRAAFDANYNEVGELRKKIELYEKQIKLNEERAAKAVGDESAKPAEPKEVRQFSFGGFVKDLSENGKPTWLYREMHEEAIKEARANGTEVNGTGIPGFILKRDSTVGTTTQGGHTVQTTIASSFIESLENKIVMNQLGAQFLTGLQGDLKIPRVSASPTATWEGETDPAAETDVTWDQITLSPNRLSGYVQVSKQLMLQSEYIFERVVSEELIRAFQRAFDSAAINGTGAPQPTGIRNTSGIGTVAQGTNGAALTYAKLVEFETTQRAANGTDVSLAYLTNAKVVGDLKTTTKDSGSGRFLYNDNMPEMPIIGYPLMVSNSVPSNLTKGTGTNLSSMIFGDFNEVLLGQWGGIDVTIDPYSSGKSGLVDIVVHMFGDVKLRHAASFVVSDDIVTTA